METSSFFPLPLPHTSSCFILSYQSPSNVYLVSLVYIYFLSCLASVSSIKRQQLPRSKKFSVILCCFPRAYNNIEPSTNIYRVNEGTELNVYTVLRPTQVNSTFQDRRNQRNPSCYCSTLEEEMMTVFGY